MSPNNTVYVNDWQAVAYTYGLIIEELVELIREGELVLWNAEADSLQDDSATEELLAKVQRMMNMAGVSRSSTPMSEGSRAATPLTPLTPLSESSGAATPSPPVNSRTSSPGASSDTAPAPIAGLLHALSFISRSNPGSPRSPRVVELAQSGSITDRPRRSELSNSEGENANARSSLKGSSSSM